MEHITLGGGCFWCLDAVYRRVRGIKASVSGYAGGELDNPTYEQVCSGASGHAEVVRLSFDSTLVSLSSLLDIFWTIHNPTTLNRQGADEGSEYRSVIFFEDETQKEIIDASIKEAMKLWGDSITTQVAPLKNFYPAEEYHQDYFNRNPARAYCSIVINPKLDLLRAKHAELTV